jgi:ATP-binding cassette subfamily F protein uup
MASAPLLQLSDVSLGFGGRPLFAHVDLVIQPGDRLALVGRNGSGKSTLLKVIAGLIEPDSGSRSVAPGVRVGYMEQDPDLTGFATLGEWAAAGLEPSERWRLEAAAGGLKFDPATPCASASGGERRRAALAWLLAGEPELMLLDEPTNHLDIEAIQWLEDRLSTTRAAWVMISHDRAILNHLSRAVLWLDRGTLRRLDQGFAAFEEWRDRLWAEEDAAAHKLDRRIKAEARWAVEGISARRRRNQGRLRRLQEMRAERAARIRRQGTAAMDFEAGPRSGRRVIEAREITKRYGEKVILGEPFSIRIMRGERVAFVGPNGVGKTTLVRMLIGKEPPDTGEVILGEGLQMAIFDQNRASLDPDATLWESLTGDKAMRVSGRSDQVMVRGQPRHVVSYLKDFLFTEEQARQPVRALSGGEKARLLLARIMARPANLLVLDEPTNDLDLETLDLLQELVADFDGTVLLVSHDRDFIDRVATTTVAMEGDGRATIYAGGWSDYIAHRGERGGRQEKPKQKAAKPKAASAESRPARAGRGLSFTERHRLEKLPEEIARLEAEISKLSELLSDPELYTRDPQKFARASEALAARQKALSAAEEEWLALAEKAEAAGEG